MALVDGLLQELENEARTTRRVLERVPNEHLAWRPHDKSRTLGELALHIATIPGSIAHIVTSASEFQARQITDAKLNDASELVPAIDDSIAKAKAKLGGMDDSTIMETWRMMNGDREIFAAPRIGVLRTVMLNHWYHHRGQLSVYLRELDVPLPSIYGPSADENPFA